MQNNPINYIDPSGLIPVETIWDLGNVFYDLITGDWEALAFDTTAMFIPYVPAGITKVVKGCKALNKARTVSERWKDFEKFPGKWKKIREMPDPRQPKGGASNREIWENLETGERLGVHRKVPTSTDRFGRPKHPHPFEPQE